jgi:hypothetical protein
MKANPDHKTLARPFHLLLVLALLAVLALGVTPPAGTAAPQESKMYVTNRITGAISRADLDGNNGESLGNLNGTLNHPNRIALALVTPQPVGGYAVAVSRVKVLAPWLALAAVGLAVAAAAALRRRRTA